MNFSIEGLMENYTGLIGFPERNPAPADGLALAPDNAVHRLPTKKARIAKCEPGLFEWDQSIRLT
jgi:hypothetical protein